MDDFTKLLKVAEGLYEDSRKGVSGRPPWRDLNPSDPYDNGMKLVALGHAMAIISVKKTGFYSTLGMFRPYPDRLDDMPDVALYKSLVSWFSDGVATGFPIILISKVTRRFPAIIWACPSSMYKHRTSDSMEGFKNNSRIMVMTHHQFASSCVNSDVEMVIVEGHVANCLKRKVADKMSKYKEFIRWWM